VSDRLSPEAQRFLDGDRSVELTDDQLREARVLGDHLEAYAASIEAPDAHLDVAVMNAIRQRSSVTRARGWRWLFQPRTVAVRPVWVPLMAAAAIAILWVSGREPVSRTAPESSVVGMADTIYVRFELAAPGARTVSLSGSFNAWASDDLPLVRRDGGVWSITVPLRVGEYEYQFLVDGTEWVPDPQAHAQIDDGFGGRNSLLVVGPKGVVRS